jgi:Uma2 family endonuclease
MQVETTKKLFTVDEYYRMAEVGILKPDDRVELIDGEIIEMSPIGNRDAGCVNRLNHLFTSTFKSRVVVSVRHPMRLNKYNEPEPDIALLRPRSDFYASKTPAADDLFLIVAVADTTLAYDRNVKVPRYAAAAVPETWIVNLRDDRLLVYRDAVAGACNTSLVLRRSESVSASETPDIVFAVDDLSSNACAYVNN